MTMSQDIVKYGFALLDSDNCKVIGIDSLSRETVLSILNCDKPLRIHLVCRHNEQTT